MANAVRRILTHKKQRKLTDEQVQEMLTDYVETDTTYEALGEKYGISGHSVSLIFRGVTYRDVPDCSELRVLAQRKAARRNGRWTHAEPVRVPDAAKMVFEVDPHSLKSIDAAMIRLQSLRSALINEADSAQISVKMDVTNEEVPFLANGDCVGLIGVERGVSFS